MPANEREECPRLFFAALDRRGRRRAALAQHLLKISFERQATRPCLGDEPGLDIRREFKFDGHRVSGFVRTPPACRASRFTLGPAGTTVKPTDRAALEIPRIPRFFRETGITSPRHPRDDGHQAQGDAHEAHGGLREKGLAI